MKCLILFVYSFLFNFFLTTIFNTSQFGGWDTCTLLLILILFSMIGMNNLILRLKKNF